MCSLRGAHRGERVGSVPEDSNVKALIRTEDERTAGDVGDAMQTKGKGCSKEAGEELGGDPGRGGCNVSLD